MYKRFSRFIALLLAVAFMLSLTAAALADYKTIPYGEQSTAVRKMQDALKTKGYYKGAVDGKFGPATKAAVLQFQKNTGITADGKPGNKTLTALYEGRGAINQANNTLQKQQTKPQNPRTLYYGCTGTRVKSLQQALRAAGIYKGPLDGVYGDLTYEAVVKYQRQNNLATDGMAGTKTLNSLAKETGVRVGSSFVLDVGSNGKEVRAVVAFLRNKGLTTVSGSQYTKQLAQDVKAWQLATGKPATGSITEAQYNSIVLGKEK